MGKLKPLLPTLREKKRYIVFQIVSNDTKMPYSKIKEHITNTFTQYVGERGAAQAGLLFLDDQYKNNQGIIRINARMVDKLKAAFCFIDSCIIDCVRVSGILKKARCR